MMSRLRERMPIQMDVYGLSAGTQVYHQDSYPWGSLGHVHTDLELLLVYEGELTLFASGRFQQVPSGQLCAFWAGMPHAVTGIIDPTEFTWVHVPLAWVLQWPVPHSFVTRLFNGEFVFEQPGPAERLIEDRLMMRRWVDEREPGVDGVLALEVEARVRRMADRAAKARSGRASTDRAGGGKLEDVLRYVSLHYGDPLTARDIGRAVGLNPGYISQLFKRGCGIGLWEYVLRLRVSHAQRLLVSGDLNVLEISVQCGFSSQGRFYEAFRRFTGTTPGEYRSAIRPQLPAV